jgi:KaiC/GvpD/RAD55 family RecA-like ATPase
MVGQNRTAKDQSNIRQELKATFARYGIKEEDVFTDYDSKTTSKSNYASSQTGVSESGSSSVAVEFSPNQIGSTGSDLKYSNNTPALDFFSGSQAIPTGVVGLDAALNGGFANHSIVLICGEIGSNYDVFVSQVLFNQLVEGKKVAYYLSDSLSTDIANLMGKFGWNLKEYSDSSTWRFVNVRTSDLEQLAQLSPSLFSGRWVRPLSGLNGLKNDLLTNIKDGCIVSLELSRLLSNFGIKDVLDFISYWRAASRVIGGVHFIILPAGVHSEAEVNALKHLADAVLEFKVTEGAYEYENTLVVSKMKGLFKPLKLPFVVNENGISIETVSRIS